MPTTLSRVGLFKYFECHIKVHESVSSSTHQTVQLAVIAISEVHRVLPLH